MDEELRALQMKGAAEGLRVLTCGSNSFSIKGMRGEKMPFVLELGAGV